MKASSHLVRLFVKFAARMQVAKDRLYGIGSGDRMCVDGNAATPVLDGDAAVFQENHLDPVAVPVECLVDRVVKDLPDQLMHAIATGPADVHARPFSNGLQSVKHLYVLDSI